MAPSDPNIVYVGSGEGLQRPDLSTGDGIYKSTDAGKTWSLMGLPESGRIGRIIIHPRDPDIVYACVLGRTTGPRKDNSLVLVADPSQLAALLVGHVRPR